MLRALSGFVLLVFCIIQHCSALELVKVYPVQETGGSFTSGQTCTVYDCVKQKPYKHSYCSPYVCTSQDSTPIEVTFDLSKYRRFEPISQATLMWTAVNTPYENGVVQWTLFANDTQISSGTVEGCKETPKMRKQHVLIDSDIIKFKWQAVGSAPFLIGRSNCRANSTDSFLQIEMAATMKYYETRQAKLDMQNVDKGVDPNQYRVANITKSRPRNHEAHEHVHDEL